MENLIKAFKGRSYDQITSVTTFVCVCVCKICVPGTVNSHGNLLQENITKIVCLLDLFTK